MLLKMITSGPNKNYRPGQLVEVDDLRAAALIQGKHAEIPREVKKHGSSSSKK